MIYSHFPSVEKGWKWPQKDYLEVVIMLSLETPINQRWLSILNKNLGRKLVTYPREIWTTFSILREQTRRNWNLQPGAKLGKDENDCMFSFNFKCNTPCSRTSAFGRCWHGIWVLRRGAYEDSTLEMIVYLAMRGMYPKRQKQGWESGCQRNLLFVNHVKIHQSFKCSPKGGSVYNIKNL